MPPRITLSIAALVLCTAPLAAQAAPSPRLLRIPASARALALGDAFVLGVPDGEAVFYNVAFPEALRGIAGGLQRYGKEGVQVSAAGGRAWLGGAAALGVRTLSYSTAPAAKVSEAALARAGTETVSEQVATAAYARRIRGVPVGVAAKVVELRTGAARDWSPAVDVAAGTEIGPVRVGLALRDLGPALELGGREAGLPTRLALDASSRTWELGPVDVVGAASADVDRDGRVLAGAGVEVGWWPIVGRTFFARMGVRGVEGGGAFPLTLGAGFAGDDIALDYAFQPLDGPGGLHRFGLSWR